jgi:branched-chain amino acid aminotransferase
METSGEIKIEKTHHSRLPELDFNKIPFGRIFSDHLMVADFKDGKWSEMKIIPYQKFDFLPGMITLHYGQSIFEGIKAFRNQANEIMLFRPDQNAKRFNISAKRMCMPEIPEEMFLKGLNSLISLDSGWVPRFDQGSLYVRPFMFGTDEFIGVHASKEYRFCVLTCPSGPYFTKPISTKIETHYSRASVGGIGFAKAAANYAGALYPTQIALNEGFDQVIWTDSKEHSYIEEAGTMNVFFRIGSKLVTPPLGDTILDGVTRKSVLQIAQDLGIVTEERRISIQELDEAYQNGNLKEAFGSGTAATICPISEIGLNEVRWSLSQNPESNEFSNRIRETINQIRLGTAPDPHGWMVPVLELEWSSINS